MKSFLKKNLYIVILIIAGIFCIFLGTFLAILLPIGLLLLAVPMAILTVKSKRKYDKLKNIDESDNIFDATKLDYDEEIYYIGEKSERNNQIKGAFSKFNAINPVIVYGFLCVAFVIMSIMGFLSINY